MTPPQSPRPPRPRSASPAERSVEFTETQRRLKREAEERRRSAEEKDAPRDQQPPESEPSGS